MRRQKRRPLEERGRREEAAVVDDDDEAEGIEDVEVDECGECGGSRAEATSERQTRMRVWAVADRHEGREASWAAAMASIAVDGGVMFGGWAPLRATVSGLQATVTGSKSTCAGDSGGAAQRISCDELRRGIDPGSATRLVV